MKKKKKGLHNKQGVFERRITPSVIKIPTYFFSRKFWKIKFLGVWKSFWWWTIQKLENSQQWWIFCYSIWDFLTG